MTPQHMQKLLATSLEDHRVSRAEKALLSQELETAGLDYQQLAHFRSVAFDLATKALATADAPLVVGWLEDIVKILQRQAAEPKFALSEAWFSPQAGCWQRIRTLLAESKQSVDICVFTITDDRLTSAVLDAHRRGVRVRIITDNDKAADLGSDANRFRDAGIDLRIDQSQYHMHHKFAIFDNARLLNGSYNWTRGAAENNEENFTVVSDARLIAAFAKTYEQLWNQLDAD